MSHACARIQLPGRTPTSLKDEYYRAGTQTMTPTDGADWGFGVGRLVWPDASCMRPRSQFLVIIFLDSNMRSEIAFFVSLLSNLV